METDKSNSKEINKKLSLVKRHYQATPFDFHSLRNITYETGLTYYILKNYNLKGKSIIDIGCSVSYNGHYIRENYPHYSYLGIDLNPKAVAIAKSKGLNVQEGDNLHLDLPDNFSDLTISEGVIHHTPDPVRCFKELIRITKKDGLVSLYVYNRHNLYFFVYKLCFPLRSLSKSKLGRRIVRKTFFPLFHLIYLVILHYPYLKNQRKLSREVSWNIFSDQILSPIAYFFTREQIIGLARRNMLTIIKEKKSTNKQGLMFIFRKN